MGTRGAYGYIKDGKPKVTYNHFDSYPTGLGEGILAYCKKFSPNAMRDHCDGITLVTEQTEPTKTQQRRLEKWTSLSVGKQSTTDWYCLLRECQGDLVAHVAAGFMIDSYNFLKDSLFCEWAYLINLDSGELEVYEGFNEAKPRSVRPGPAEGWLYYPVTLIASYPLSELPENLKALEESEDESNSG